MRGTLATIGGMLLGLGCGGAPPPPTEAAPESEGDIPEALAYESERVTLSPEPDRWPEPPRQGERWTSPAGADPVIAETARLLFDELGAPDPRGLERRWVKVLVRQLWDGAAEETLRAWVLPEPAVDGRRFVIAPDGLMHLAHVVFAADHEPEDRPPRLDAAPPITRDDTLVALAFRLRAGESVRPPDERVQRDPESWSARSAASDWAWARVERAITAHMHGDDPLALRDLTILERLHQDHRRSFDLRKAGFDSAMALVADQRRRARERRRDGAPRLPRSADAPGETRGDVAVRVMGLIRELDQVAQWGEPEEMDLTGDPVVRELVGIGDPAVEPLLDVLERDERMTRSVHFGLDSPRSWTVLGVHEAAHAALTSILQRSFAASDGAPMLRDPAGRQSLVTTIRAYWQRYGAFSLTERWYVTLKDDAAGLEEWCDAAEAITTPSHAPVGSSSWEEEGSAGPPSLRGEGLRDGHDPSVTALLSKRLGEARPMDERGCRLALAAEHWDRAGTERAMGRARDACFESGCPCLPELIARARGRGVVRRYLRWLAAFTPSAETVGWALRPAVELEGPAVRRAVARLFRRPVWVEATTEAFTQGADQHLLALPPVRRALANALSDCTPIGEIVVGENGYTYTHRGGGGALYGDAPDAAPPGTVMPLRRCDRLAMSVAPASSVGSYWLSWPEALRDEALVRVRRWLREEGRAAGSTAP